MTAATTTTATVPGVVTVTVVAAAAAATINIFIVIFGGGIYDFSEIELHYTHARQKETEGRRARRHFNELKYVEKENRSRRAFFR